MNSRVSRLAKILLAAAVLLVVGSRPLPAATPPARAGTVSVRLLDLTAPVPAAWVSQPPSSSMRLAQFRVPGKSSPDDAECVVFYFGEGQGGSPEANIARWQSQFSSPDGKPVKPSVQHFRVSGIPVTTAELTGTYARSMGMGPPAAPASDQTLLAAIVETAKGNLYFQLHGPKASVAANREAFLGMLRGIKKP
ncbi:MAG TPA: hypothetical protein VLT62_27535 [Candidatus Methylomirabilis sp.]|nr:hypothetical protein [Candidatus Methylomirabilis sp.]